MKMFPKNIRRYIIVGAVSVCSFTAGVYIERYNIINAYQTLRKINLPALPLYATVSAASPVSPAVTPASGRVSQIMKYGFPGLDNIRSYDDFVLSYDRRTRVAHWVFEHITAESIAKNDKVDRGKCAFQPDESVHEYFRVLNSDYKGSGFDRGHLAAAGNHRQNQKCLEQTFYLTNMAPQVGDGFNRDAWNKLESRVRKLARAYKNVYCCTGPLYLPKKEADGKLYVKYQVIGANHVAVPTHFYKVIVAETDVGRLDMEAYVMPNQVINKDESIKNYRVPPETIERAAGLLFFDNISRSKLYKINGKKV